MRTIRTNSAQCGIGKTTNLVKQAKLLQSLGESVLIVQPSIYLLNENHAKIPRSEILHSDVCNNVAFELNRRTKQTSRRYKNRIKTSQTRKNKTIINTNYLYILRYQLAPCPGKISKRIAHCVPAHYPWKIMAVIN